MLDLKHNNLKGNLNELSGVTNLLQRHPVFTNDDEMKPLKPFFDTFRDIENRKLNTVILSWDDVHKLNGKVYNEIKRLYKNIDDTDLLMEDVLCLEQYNSPFDEFSVELTYSDNSKCMHMDIKYYNIPLFYQDNKPVKYLISVTDYDNFPTFRFMLIVTEDSTGKYNIDFITHHGNPIMTSSGKRFIYDINHSESSSNAHYVMGLVMYILSAMLYAFNKKSEIFIETQEKYKVRNRSSEKKKNVKKHPIKVRKVFRIDDDQLEDLLRSKSTHVITCESWEVSGHYRTYKNGKKVWIKPYRKGKKRDEVTPIPNTYIV